MRKRIAAAALCLLMLLAGACSAFAEGETGLEQFHVRHGSRESKKIAITMDDVYEREWVWKAADLCREYGIRMTFFPIGINLHEEDAENWRQLVADGFEIGSHSNRHESFHDIDRRIAIGRLGTFQETLDRVLGFHYEVRWFRPPFGNIVNEDGSYDAMRKLILAFGYEHVLLWDVSQTDPQLAIGKVRNGSVLLYHARHKDYACLELLIPQLLEAGFEPVTVSELFGYPPPETGEELYVYNWEDYKDKVR